MPKLLNLSVVCYLNVIWFYCVIGNFINDWQNCINIKLSLIVCLINTHNSYGMPLDVLVFFWDFCTQLTTLFHVWYAVPSPNTLNSLNSVFDEKKKSFWYYDMSDVTSSYGMLPRFYDYSCLKCCISIKHSQSWCVYC